MKYEYSVVITQDMLDAAEKKALSGYSSYNNALKEIFEEHQVQLGNYLPRDNESEWRYDCKTNDGNKVDFKHLGSRELFEIGWKLKNGTIKEGKNKLDQFKESMRLNMLDGFVFVWSDMKINPSVGDVVNYSLSKYYDANNITSGFRQSKFNAYQLYQYIKC